MLRRSSLIECVSVLHGNRCLQSINFLQTMSNFNDSVFIGHIFLVCIYISYTALLKLKFSFLVQIICELKRALYGIKCVLRIF
jgi:hypothetical protein